MRVSTGRQVTKPTNMTKPLQEKKKWGQSRFAVPASGLLLAQGQKKGS
jgi:hypothetical protein